MPSDDSSYPHPFAGLRLEADPDRPATLEDTATMFERVVDAITSAGAALSSVSKLQDQCFTELERQHQELVQLRAELVALSNRIEATNRVLASRTDHLA